MYCSITINSPPTPPPAFMEPKGRAEVLKIPQNLLEKLLPSSHASVQELLAHKIPYHRPSAARTDAAAYLVEDAPTCPKVDVFGVCCGPLLSRWPCTADLGRGGVSTCLGATEAHHPSGFTLRPSLKWAEGRPLRPHDSDRTNPTARLVKERLIRVPVCPPRRVHQMSICQCKVDAKGSIAPGSPASPAEVDNMHPSGRVDAGRIGRSVFEIKNGK
ncbi:hypothetical protein B0H14DRAFT_3139857 [Mycena olivaceomarginata]|nr:hypothetical protein B0H14DRAFT_3139857 [Mycena olivaceomarginata]